MGACCARCFGAFGSATAADGGYQAVGPNSGGGGEIALISIRISSGETPQAMQPHTAGDTDDDVEAWNDFDDWDAQATAAEEAESRRAQTDHDLEASATTPVVAGAAGAVASPPAIAPLSSPTYAAASSVPMLKPPPAAVASPVPPAVAAVAAAPAQDLFGSIAVGAYVDAPRASVKPTAASSSVASLAPTIPPPVHSSRFDVDQLMHDASHDDTGATSLAWGEPSAVAAHNSSANSYSAHDPDADIDLDIDLQELGIDLGEEPTAAHHTTASAPAAAAGGANASSARDQKKPKVLIAAAPDSDIDDIDLDAL